MTKDELLKTVWGSACANLGYPVCNAYFYREEGVPKSVTDKAITAECERILAEPPPAPVTPTP
jgi:hypothetical protein